MKRLLIILVLACLTGCNLEWKCKTCVIDTVGWCDEYGKCSYFCRNGHGGWAPYPVVREIISYNCWFREKVILKDEV